MADTPSVFQLPLRRKASGDVADAFLSSLLAQATLHRQQGRLEAAATAYHMALQRRPRDYDAAYGLGLVHVQLGDLEPAQVALGLAIEERPYAAEAHHALALAFLAARRLPEAIDSFQRVLRLEPDRLESLNGLGLALISGGRPSEALAFFERALALAPDYAAAHHGQGFALKMLGRPAQAIEHYRRAMALGADPIVVGVDLGLALQSVNQTQEALACYDWVIGARPNHAVAHHNRAIALEQLGRLQEARDAFEKAVALAPGRAEHYNGLARHRRFTADDPKLAAMIHLAREENRLPPDERIELHFALAKAFDDLGRHEESFRHLLAGNAFKRARTPYDETGTLAMFERIETVFTKDLAARQAGLGDPSPIPIFVLGMPRSGTTLVEQIIASHPATFGAGEITDLTLALQHRLGQERPPADYPEAMPTLSTTILGEIGADYVARIRSLAPAATRIVNKMPANFFLVGLIRAALPNARILHLSRDPVETCFSCFTKLFASGQMHTYDLAELGRYYRAYARLMQHWRDVLGPDAMLDVTYEDIVEDLEGQARRIIAYCDLDWDDACLTFHTSDRVVRTASSGQVRRTIYRTSLQRARPYARELRPLIEALGPELPGSQ